MTDTEDIFVVVLRYLCFVKKLINRIIIRKKSTKCTQFSWPVFENYISQEFNAELYTYNYDCFQYTCTYTEVNCIRQRNDLSLVSQKTVQKQRMYTYRVLLSTVVFIRLACLDFYLFAYLHYLYRHSAAKRFYAVI